MGDIRPLKVLNTTSQQEEIFYPATTTDAIADRTRQKSLANVLSDINDAVGNREYTFSAYQRGNTLWIKEFSPNMSFSSEGEIVCSVVSSSQTITKMSLAVVRGGTTKYMNLEKKGNNFVFSIQPSDALVSLYISSGGTAGDVINVKFIYGLTYSVNEAIPELHELESYTETSIQYAKLPVVISGQFCYFGNPVIVSGDKMEVDFSIINETTYSFDTVNCVVTHTDDTTAYKGSLSLTDTITDSKPIKSLRFYINKPESISGDIMLYLGDALIPILSRLQANNYGQQIASLEKRVGVFELIECNSPSKSGSIAFLSDVINVSGSPTRVHILKDIHLNFAVSTLNVAINGSTYIAVPNSGILENASGINTLRFYVNIPSGYDTVSGYSIFSIVQDGDFISQIINDEPFANKVIKFVGDSITAANSDSGLGWAGRSGNILKMNWQNLGTGGWTTETGSSDTSIIKKIEGISSADYVIVQPSTVNHQQGWTLGELTQESTNFDTTTYYGALEYIAQYCITHFSKVGFIIHYKVGEAYNTAINTTYPTAIKNVAEKWGIPCLNLNSEAGFNLVNASVRAIYGVDNTNVPTYNTNSSYSLDDRVRYNGYVYKAKVNISAPAGTFDSSKWTGIGTEYDNCHCNSDGYKVLTNKVVEFIKKL